MQAKIKSIHLENFKGVKQAAYQFDGRNANIIGENGAGKTTIFTAYMWLMADKDSDLKSNPNIRPLDIEECTPRVEVVFDVGGKEITVAKIQKCTVKKSKTGGADTVSLSNSYEVNSVECGERDFKKKMAEYGFDFDLFLPLSHPDVFTEQKAADMRKVLFGMASEKTDKEITDLTEGAVGVAEMLANYTAEEVKAMQNTTLRKIKEVYGKNGEILRAKIEGMEQTKTDIDVAKLEFLKKVLDEQIAANKAKREDISKEFEEQQKASDGILELKFELNDLQRKANEENKRKRREVEEEISSADMSAQQHSRTIILANDKIVSKKRDLSDYEKYIAECRDMWNETNTLEFDENSLFCPMCGQELPEDKKGQERSKFEKYKTEKLADISDKGNGWKQRIKETKAEIEQLEKSVEIATKQKEMAEKRSEELEEQLDKLPQSIDISDRPEVQEIQKQIAEKEAAMNKGSSADEIRKQLKAEGEDLQKQMDKVNEQFALAKKNTEIDEQIADLQKKQDEYEQSKADAEKILYQLDLVSRKKNELLTEDINRNFDIVRWQLFEYQKNGEYKSCCVPLVDGKRFGESTNTGREVLAKLDIIKGLQRFYGQNYPVFLDGAECLSEETRKRIDMDCQIIYLSVSEDKELRIETEG